MVVEWSLHVLWWAVDLWDKLVSVFFFGVALVVSFGIFVKGPSSWSGLALQVARAGTTLTGVFDLGSARGWHGTDWVKPQSALKSGTSRCKRIHVQVQGLMFADLSPTQCNTHRP